MQADLQTDEEGASKQTNQNPSEAIIYGHDGIFWTEGYNSRNLVEKSRRMIVAGRQAAGAVVVERTSAADVASGGVCSGRFRLNPSRISPSLPFLHNFGLPFHFYRRHPHSSMQHRRSCRTSSPKRCSICTVCRGSREPECVYILTFLPSRSNTLVEGEEEEE